MTYLLASSRLGIGSFLLHTIDHGSGIFPNNTCFPASNIWGVGPILDNVVYYTYP